MAWSSPPTRLAGGFWAEMYIVELAGAPTELEGRLVARIMPDPATGAFETAVQRHLNRCSFPVPAIRCAGGPSIDLDRAWSVMDFASGQPMLAGLSAGKAIKRAPILLRRLPDLLAEAAAALHDCPIDGLHVELASPARQPDIEHFLERVAAQAGTIGRPDLARTAEQLAASAHDPRVICHGDLHPFNLLVDGDEWTLIDWSTAVVADPHYDLAFTTLMLANPPLGGPHRSEPRLERSAPGSPTASCAATNNAPGAAPTPTASTGDGARTRCAPSSRSPPGRPTTRSTTIADIPG